MRYLPSDTEISRSRIHPGRYRFLGFGPATQLRHFGQMTHRRDSDTCRTPGGRRLLHHAVPTPPRDLKTAPPHPPTRRLHRSPDPSRHGPRPRTLPRLGGPEHTARRAPPAPPDVTPTTRDRAPKRGPAGRPLRRDGAGDSSGSRMRAATSDAATTEARPRATHPDGRRGTRPRGNKGATVHGGRRRRTAPRGRHYSRR